jgi:hypothetical protein
MARGNSTALLRRALAANAGVVMQSAGRGASTGALTRGMHTARTAAGALNAHKCNSCGRVACMGHGAGYATASSAALALAQPVEQVLSPSERLHAVLDAFPTALSVDDFMARVEMALAAYGFTGANSIGKGCSGTQTAQPSSSLYGAH